MRLPWRSRRQREEELRAEIEAHLRMAVADRVARGESPGDATRAARREFGNVALVEDVTRETWGGMWLDRLLRDLRHGARGLRRSPGFATVAVLTLALGVGANTAVFTVVNGVLLRPLPFERPHELFLLSYTARDAFFQGPPSLDEGTYVELRLRNRTFDRIAMFNAAAHTLTDAGEPARVPSALVTADFTSVLGVDAAVGRTFLPGEDTPGNAAVVLLGDRLWRERFAAEPGVVGRTVTLDGVSHTVVGVMPPGFDFPFDAQLWVPMVLGLDPGNVFVRPVVGRLRPGVTREESERELERIAADVGFPVWGGARASTRLLPLRDLLTERVERSLLVLAGAVAFVLLIACANVANLLLIRGAERRHEIVVRTALGAGRGRIVRQLLTESALVAALGAVAGVLLASWGVRGLLAIAPPGRIPRVDEVHVDGVVLGVSLGVTLLAGLAFGLAPALAVTARGAGAGLGGAARTVGGGHERLRLSLAVAEIALAIVLLTGAGLLLRSFSRVRSVDLGFRPDHVVAMRVELPDAGYPGAPEMRRFHAAVLQGLSGIPGVEHAGAVNWAPLGANLVVGDFAVEGMARPPGYVLDKLTATPGYFRAMGIGLLHGRELTVEDDERAPGAVVISRSVAERFWPPDGAEAVGKRLAGSDAPAPEDWLTIVGVVEDVVQRGLAHGRGAAMYTPVQQASRPFFLGEMTFVVRTQRDPADVMQAMRAVVGEVDPRLPMSLATMDERVSRALAEPRFEARLLAVFSTLALLLAAVGTYGVIAYGVASRTREIGLRMALGAARRNVVGMVLRQVLWVTGPGILLGVVGALALTRILKSSLFEVTPSDPPTYATVAALLTGVAVAAALVPTLRAMRVHPVVALRHEG